LLPLFYGHRREIGAINSVSREREEEKKKESVNFALPSPTSVLNGEEGGGGEFMTCKIGKGEKKRDRSAPCRFYPLPPHNGGRGNKRDLVFKGKEAHLGDTPFRNCARPEKEKKRGKSALIFIRTLRSLDPLLGKNGKKTLENGGVGSERLENSRTEKGGKSESLLTEREGEKGKKETNRILRTTSSNSA